MTTLLQDALFADGPAADRADKMALYAFLVGRWACDVRIHMPDGATRESTGTITAGWVLEGKAIQDVWVLPGVFHGTTLRVYDPALDAWRIHWLDPVRQNFPHMIGRAVGPSIVQHGQDDATGVPLRWSFNDIGPDSFHWKADIADGDRRDWRLQLEFLARREA